MSLREDESLQNILSIKSPLKRILIVGWKISTITVDRGEKITSLSLIHNEIEENEFSDDARVVAVNVAGYATMNIMNKVDCANCLEILQSNKVTSGHVK